MALGFYWSANSAYIRPMWVRVRVAPRAPALSTTLYDGLIANPESSSWNANPAYLIYEVLTNTDWGLGFSPTQLDTPSFASAAATLLAENFGLFVTWVKQDTIESFTGEILDHIQGVLFLHPATGLWTLRLLRADYDPANLPRYNPDNANIEDFDRRVWGETINEIVVTWTNPVNEQAETVTIQDLANIVQQGGQIVSQARDYYGIRNPNVASVVASRDLRTAVAPLAKCTLKAFRSAWDRVPGDCIVLDWPEENVEGLVMRVQQVDYGTRSDGYVVVSLLEDIFARDAPVYVGAPGSSWLSPVRAPNDFEHVKLITAPAYMVANASPPITDTPVEPEVFAAVLASDPNTDIINLEPYTDATSSTGSVISQNIGTRNRVGYSILVIPLTAQAITEAVVATFDLNGLPRIRVAQLLFIGGGGDTATEVVLVQSVNEIGTYTLLRGALDTVPRDWPVGTPVWAVGSESVFDTTPRAPGETVSYKLLMRTTLGLLPLSQANSDTITLSARPYLPMRPANVKVNGTAFGTIAIPSGDAVVTWAQRNRLTETNMVVPWDAGNVTPESGQTTIVSVLDSAGAETQVYTGQTGTTFTIPRASLAGGAFIAVELARGSYRSLQRHILPYTL